MVASTCMKRLAILLAICVVGTLGQLGPLRGGPLRGRIGGGFLPRGGLLGGRGLRPGFGNPFPGFGGGIDTAGTKNAIEDCRRNGGHMCYDSIPSRRNCISREQICNGVRECRYGDDESPNCASNSDLITTSFVFETTTTTSTPSTSYTSTLTTTSTVTGTTTSYATSTSTSTVWSTSVLQASLAIGSTSSVSSVTSVFIIPNINRFATITMGAVLPAGVLTCSSSTIPAGGLVVAGDNDYLFQTITVSREMTVEATASCSPTSTLFY